MIGFIRDMALFCMELDTCAKVAKEVNWFSHEQICGFSCGNLTYPS